MDCNFEKSDRIHKNGKPYWFCSRKGCPNRCVSDDGKCKSVCGHPSWNIPLGDIAATLIKVVTLGLVKPTPSCRCKDRQKQMNKAGTIPKPDFLVSG